MDYWEIDRAAYHYLCEAEEGVRGYLRVIEQDPIHEQEVMSCQQIAGYLRTQRQILEPRILRHVRDAA